MSQRTIPVISSLPELTQWQAGLRGGLKIAVAPPVVANLRVSTKQGGNFLEWSPITGAHGYRVEVSEDGDFSTILTSINLVGNQAVTWFDTVGTSSGTAPTKRYYRVSATSGTVRNPQSTQGKPSGVVGASAIAPNDVVTAPATSVDTINYDALNKNSGTGPYASLEGPSGV